MSIPRKPQDSSITSGAAKPKYEDNTPAQKATGDGPGAKAKSPKEAKEMAYAGNLPLVGEDGELAKRGLTSEIAREAWKGTGMTVPKSSMEGYKGSKGNATNK